MADGTENAVPLKEEQGRTSSATAQHSTAQQRRERTQPMSKRLNLGAAVAAAAVFVSAPYASAAGGREHPKPVVTAVKTVAPFDWSAGEVPENITVNPDSTLTEGHSAVRIVRHPPDPRQAPVRETARW